MLDIAVQDQGWFNCYGRPM